MKELKHEITASPRKGGAFTDLVSRLPEPLLQSDSLSECPLYPESGHCRRSAPASAKCHKQTWHSRMAVHCTPGESPGIVDV
jgi:hypothetical protein